MPGVTTTCSLCNVAAVAPVRAMAPLMLACAVKEAVLSTVTPLRSVTTAVPVWALPTPRHVTVAMPPTGISPAVDVCMMPIELVMTGVVPAGPTTALLMTVMGEGAVALIA